MSKYIGGREYDGTLERAIALILDQNLIFAETGYILDGGTKGMEGLTEKLCAAARARHNPPAPPTMTSKSQAISVNSNFKGFSRDGIGVHSLVAYLNGYPVGDRALEGVYFRCEIMPGGMLLVSCIPQHQGYFETLNTKKWLKAVLDYACNPKNDAQFNLLPNGQGEDVGLLRIEKPQPEVPEPGITETKAVRAPKRLLASHPAFLRHE